MWIWELDHTDGGDLSRIIAGARAYRITTLIIKSSDGASAWSQFNPQVVSALHAAGLKVAPGSTCTAPTPRRGQPRRAGGGHGADCLVIDAEAEYEGRYAAAQTYINDLRAKIGTAYPLALAGFPYVDYHPALPYSVFLGPDGAQYNVPQMYWKDIGVSVDTVYANTYINNRIYARPIFPLGQVYGGAATAQIEQFRRLALQYGARRRQLVGLAGGADPGVDRGVSGALLPPPRRHAVAGGDGVGRPSRPRRPRGVDPGAPARRREA